MWLHARTPWFLEADGLRAAPIFIGTALIGLALGLFAAGLLRFARVGTGILLQRPATGW
jgi:hypothetical protein